MENDTFGPLDLRLSVSCDILVTNGETRVLHFFWGLSKFIQPTKNLFIRVRIWGWCSPRMRSVRFGEKKLIFFLCHLYWVYVHLGAKIIVSACLWRRWHQKKCPTDREKSFWALQTISLKSGGARKSGPASQNAVWASIIGHRKKTRLKISD